MKGLVILRCAVLLKLFSKKNANLGVQKTATLNSIQPGGQGVLL
jgi:hypothetical protein